MKLLIINPGSTSTKISLFEDEKELFTKSVFHDAPVLLQYKEVNDQLSFRSAIILELLKMHGYTLSDIDVFVGRGGCAYSQSEGVMVIDERLYKDTVCDKGGSDHPAKLGVMIAYNFMKETGKPAYTVNPTNVDELCDEARITGIKGLYKRAQTHVLNQKGIARLHSSKMNKRYEEANYIVCHIDGGITITAHKNGKMIDSTEGAGGDGPFTPTRLGSIPVLEVVKFLENHTTDELKAMCSRSGGFVSHFGTSNADTIHALVLQGDKKACTIWASMVYQLAKEIGAMAAVLDGKVDAILLTGGLVRFQDIVDTIKTKCSFIAPIFTYPGEIEQEAMNEAALEVINGKATARVYTGSPIWEGFAWDKE